MKGQGLVEWALILVLILVLVVVILIVIAAVFFPGLENVRGNNPCRQESSFACKDERVRLCLETERYTKDQCVILVGGGSK